MEFAQRGYHGEEKQKQKQNEATRSPTHPPTHSLTHTLLPTTLITHQTTPHPHRRPLASQTQYAYLPAYLFTPCPTHPPRIVHPHQPPPVPHKKERKGLTSPAGYVNNVDNTIITLKLAANEMENVAHAASCIQGASAGFCSPS